MAIHYTAKIHSSAIIEEGAIVGKHCEVGAYSIVTKNVQLADSVIVKSHVVIESNTFVDQNTIIDNHCSIGSVPNEYKHDNTNNYLAIGKNCTFYNLVTINAGKKYTKVGNNCVFMSYSGIGHDSTIDDFVIFSPCAGAAGNVVVGSYCVFGMNSNIHQHCRIGEGSMLGAVSFSSRNILPYSLVAFNPGKLVGCNIIGMKRRGINKKVILNLNKMYKNSPTKDILSDSLNEFLNDDEVYLTVNNFINQNYKRETLFAVELK